MEDIDPYKTIFKGRLIYKTHYREFFELFILGTIGFFLFLFTFLGIVQNEPSWIIVPLIIFSTYSGLYYFSNKACRKLIKVDNSANKELIMKRLLDYLKQNGYKVKFISFQHLKAISGYDILLHKNELTLIFTEKNVLINLISGDERYRFPLVYNKDKKINELKSIINAGT